MPTRNDPTADFTHILLPYVMDYLELPDLLSCVAVARAWRSHAINHPTYYADIWSDSYRPYGGTEFFLLRLSRANGRPVAITAELTQLEPVLSNIFHHLNHIRSLCLTSPAGPESSRILAEFRRPAPILEHLDLNFDPTCTGGPTSIVMPWDLFAGEAPMLRTAVIVCVSIPHATLPPCLAALEELSFGTLWPVAFDDQLLVVPPFPRLRRLKLMSAVTLETATCNWQALSEIAFCEGNIARNWHTLNLPISGVQKICVSNGDADAVLALARTLQGALFLDFLRFDRDIDDYVTFRAAMYSTENHTERVREVYGFIYNPLILFATIIGFSSPDLADRVVRLAFRLRDWDLFVGRAQLRRFSALEDLDVKIDRDSSWPAYSAELTLACPALRRLHVVAPVAEAVAVDPASLVVFVSTRLQRVRFPLELRLHGAIQDCNPDDFPDVFKRPGDTSRDKSHDSPVWSV